ncbi:PFD6 [Auxenochlorella protothecoides x Auxenochlorella symbiontica]|uniref:Prefoldin subunit 6 n=1 Tax=Auxenochlorella protothecoides TaxID=3075 RepID=A0A1D2ADE7_AUXPR
MDRANALQRELREEADAFQAIQQDVNKNHNARQQFLQQQNENEMVFKELEISGEEGAVYKLIGPALVRQDALEARANVKKRLEFIASELARLDSQLKALEEKQTRKHNQMIKLQQEAQRLQQQAVQTA